MDALLNTVPCGFLCFSDDGKMHVINKTLCDLLGYKKKELQGEAIDRILTLSSRVFYNTHLFPLLRLHSTAEEIFISLLAKSGDHIPVLLNAARRLENGDFLNYCVFFPVHQRKKYEDEILAAKRQAEAASKKNQELIDLKHNVEINALDLDRKVSRLLAINQNLIEFNRIISHDFQESIRKIKFYSGNLVAKAHVDDCVPPRELTKILRAADRLENLASMLELFVELDGGRQRAEVNLEQLILDCRAEVEKHRRFKDFGLHISGLVPIEGNRQQLKLLFFHLIDNSVASRDENRHLVITVTGVVIQENIFRATLQKYKYADCLKITFKDNAKGFDNRYKDYIFSLLKKINPEAEGLGIGLAICRKVLDNHSGSIDVHSEEGMGTEFRLILPLRTQLSGTETKNSCP